MLTTKQLEFYKQRCIKIIDKARKERNVILCLKKYQIVKLFDNLIEKSKESD